MRNNAVLFFATLCLISWGSLPATHGQAVATPEETDSSGKTSNDTKEDLPSAEQVVDDYIKATGGKERMEKTKSIVIHGVMSIPAAGVKADMVITIVAPIRMVVNAEIEGIGSITRCVDKGRAWEIDPMMGPRLLDGEELRMAIREADTTAALHPEKYFKKMECTGIEDIDGKPAYRVVATTLDDSVETNFYDKQSKLMVRIDRDQQTALGKIKTEIRLSDYRDEDGFVMPHKTVIDLMGQQQIVTIQSVEINKDYDETAFEVPEEIQELLAMKKKKAAKESATDGQARETKETKETKETSEGK